MQAGLFSALICLTASVSAIGVAHAPFAGGDDRSEDSALCLRCPRAVIEIQSPSSGSWHSVTRVSADSRSAGVPRDGESTIDPSISLLTVRHASGSRHWCLRTRRKQLGLPKQ